MKSGTVIALVAVLAYGGFEAYAIREASERMEPAYIYSMLVETKTGVELCDSIDPDLQRRFESTLERVTQRYRDEIEKENPEWEAAQIKQQLEQSTQAAVTTANSSLANTDCLHKQAKAYSQRYKIYARRSS